MQSQKLLSLFLFVILAYFDGVKPEPELVLYYANGEEFNTTEDHASGLPAVPTTSYCVSGIWIIHPSANYAGIPTRVISSNDGSQCGEIIGLNLPIVSARIAGFRPDNSVPSVTFFSGDNFKGERLVFGESVTEVPFSVTSFITINSPRFEVYEYPNHEGDSFCFENMDCSPDGVCFQWFYSSSSLPWGTAPQSAKVGCNSSA